MEASPNQRDHKRLAVRVRLSPTTVPKEHRQEIPDKLCIYFQSKQGGDCDVEYIHLLGEDASGSEYRVVFVEPSGASNLLEKPDHAMVIDGVKIPLEVQSCQAPPGFSVSSSVEVPPGSIDLQSFVCVTQKDINKDTVGGVTEQNQAWQSDDKTQLQMTSTGASGDAQKGTSRIAASFTTQGATQQLSPEKNIKVDPADQASSTRLSTRLSDAVDTESEDMYGVTGGVHQVTCDVPSCCAPPGLGIQHLTDSRGRVDMYGKDEHHQSEDPRLLGNIFSPSPHQVQGIPYNIWAPQGGTMDTNNPLGFQGYPWPVENMTNETTQHQMLFPKQPLDNQFHERGSHDLFLRGKQGRRSHDLFLRGKQGDQFQGNCPATFSPQQSYFLKHRFPFTQASCHPGDCLWPNATPMQFPIGEQKQTVAPEGTSPGGMLENATHRSVSAVNNQQAVRADTIRRHPAAAVRRSLDGDSSFKENSGIKEKKIKDDPEEDDKLIEVTGLKRSTDYEVLKLYFQSNRKSGGGEIQKLERHSKSGAIRITFMNPSVAAVVVRRKHKLMGTTLTVNLITKKKCLPLPIKGTVTSTDSVGGRYQNIFLPVEVPIDLKTPRITVSGLNVVTKEGMTIKLTKGNIAVQKVDVILNTVGSDLNMKSGKVSQAISLAAGPTLQQECDTLRAVRGSVASWSFLETRPGLLTCKKIYHCVCEGYKTFLSEQLLKKLLVELMADASSNGMTSMAIPALGTGRLSYPPAVTARCMYEAAFEFSIQHPNGSLKDVRFVVYDKDMNTIKGFEDEIQRLNPSSPGASGGAIGGVTGNTKKNLSETKISTADFFYKKIPHETNSFEAGQEEDLQEHVIPQLGAMDMNSLIKASVKLHAEEVQNDKFLSEDFPDVMGLIDKMTLAHLAELEQIGGKHNVTAEPSDAKSIHVEGSRINVKEALLDISHLFLRIQKEETEKQKIEHLAKEVKWKNSTPSAAIFEKPTNWITMKKGELTKMVKLTAGTDEYRAVETNFRLSPMSAFNQVVEIQRVQNQALLMQYQARKAALEIRLKRSDVEKILFHGTDEQTCNDISRHGFNRSFCGKNANVYGKGTYFAVQAGYSARRDYAKPNANGIMHLLMAKVLVGDYIRGCQDISSPPKKPQSPGELYDSVVDNMNTPGIYVIFHDAQAYPEYLIKFQ